MSGRGARQVLQRLANGEAVAVGGCLLVAEAVHSDVVTAISCDRHSPPPTPRPAPPRTPAPAPRPTPRRTPTRLPISGGGGRCVLGERGALSRAVARQLQSALADPSCAGERRRQALGSLSRSPEPWARVDAARDLDCPRAAVERLAGDWWWEVRAAAASHPGLSEDTGRRLARDPSPWVRRALAESRRASSWILEVLAGDSDMGVRDAVAEHPECPADLLVRLAEDRVWEVRRSVAKRPNAPAAALAALAGDPEHWVRFFVACNPATPDEVRRALEADPRPSVRTVARRSARRERSIAMYLALEPRSAPGRRTTSS